jgi:phage terminase large subunit-like protein
MNKAQVLEKLPDYLNSFKEDKDFYQGIDERLFFYMDNVLSNPDKHNAYEILAVFRFMNLTDKYDFNILKFNKFVRFYESLAFPSEIGLQCFKLTPVQIFQFANIYGLYKEDGYRLCNDALLYVPRKFSKTTSVAACAIYDLMFGPNDAQAYVASNSFNQARICFEIISNSLKPLDPSMKYFKRTKEKIYSKIPGRTSFIQCLSASPDRLDGLAASTIILDEYAAAPNAALKNVLTSSQGIRKEPLIITITTASSNLDGPFNTIDLPNYKKILEGTIEDDTVFASIFEPDEGDDYSSTETWNKVQPHLGVTVTMDFYQRSWTKALRSAEDNIEFKTKLLNVFVPPAKLNWISSKIIEKQTVKLNLTEFTAHPICMVGVDLSVLDDMSAVTYGMYDSINKKFYFKNEYYIPKNTIENHPNSELYRRWVENGWLHICGEEVIDYQQIAQDIIDNSHYVNILSINYDQYRNREFVNYLKAQGIKCLKPYKQTYAQFTSPVEAFEQSLYEDRIYLDENPIIAWNINNAVLDEDSMKNRKPIKVSHNRKIDGLVTILMSLGAFMSWKR